MKLLSQGTKYAISAVIALSRQPAGATISASALPKSLNRPPAYLSPILSKLKLSGILKPPRGLNGGAYLNRRPRDISLSNIIEVIDGTDFFSRCFMGIECCAHDEMCPFHGFWAAERNKIRQWLQDTTFERIDRTISDRWVGQHFHFYTHSNRQE